MSIIFKLYLLIVDTFFISYIVLLFSIYFTHMSLYCLKYFKINIIHYKLKITKLNFYFDNLI